MLLVVPPEDVATGAGADVGTTVVVGGRVGDGIVSGVVV